MGSYWLTTLSAIRRSEPDWRAIAAYEAPVRRYLGRFRLPDAERDDLVQEVLLAMRERIVPGYDPAAGAFRPYLRTAIANRVRDHFRRRRADPAAAPLPEVADDWEPTAAEAATLDLEAAIVKAVRAVHDRYAQGPERDLELVWVLSGVLVHGLSNAAVAQREGLSVDQVKRKLQRARSEVLETLFRDLLGGDAPETAPARCADLARACLRTPRKEARLLEREPDAGLRERVAELIAGLRTARTHLGAGGGEAEGDLLRGIEAIFAA